MNNYESYMDKLNSFNPDEKPSTYETRKAQRLAKSLEKLETEEAIIKYFHSPYNQNMKKDLLPVAQYLGFDVTGKTSRTDIIYLIQKHYLDKLKDNKGQ